MMIICIEGASAVGKSTTCQQFANMYNTYIVQETAFLFRQPSLEGKELMQWMLDRQIERWKIAQEKQEKYEYVILDGDIFKLWYSWIYGFQYISLEEAADFFLNNLLKGEIAFPDGYVLFWIEEDKLRKRKEADPTRSRRNFERHLSMIEPQKRYFEYLNKLIPNYVRIQKAETIQPNIQAIIDQTEVNTQIKDQGIKIFNSIVDFYKNNKA